MSDDFDFDDDFFGDDDDFGFDDINDLRDDDDDLSSFNNDSIFDDDDDDAGDSAFFDDDDDLGGFADDDDGFSGLDDYDEDFFEDEEETEGGGTNRNFIIAIGVLAAIFICGLLAVVVIFLSGDGESSEAESTRAAFNATATAITDNNNQVMTEIIMSETQAVVNQTADAEILIANETASAEAVIAQQTQDALDLTATAEADFLAQTQTVEAQSVDLDATQTEQARIAQLTADAETTEDGPPATATELGTSSAPNANEVALTATALQLTLFPSGNVTPTREDGDSQTVQPTANPNACIGTACGGELPETGLNFDSQSLPMIALIIFGLVGVIFGARHLRSTATKTTKK